MKNLKTTFLAHSWMAKTVVKVFPRGKVFWVRAYEGSEVAMKMTAKWCSAYIKKKDLSGLASLKSISGIMLWSPFSGNKSADTARKGVWEFIEMIRTKKKKRRFIDLS